MNTIFEMTSPSHSYPASIVSRHSRRRLLEVGAAAPFGLYLPQLFAVATQSNSSGLPGFGKAKSCVVIFLWGGPGQQDLWDPKPEAPSVVRSEFAPISTSVTGTQLTDQLPQLSRQAERVLIVRPGTHKDF